MPQQITITKEQKRKEAEIHGNNVAALCPCCGQVYIYSAYTDHHGRDCPSCRNSRITVVMEGTHIKHAVLESE